METQRKTNVNFCYGGGGGGVGCGTRWRSCLMHYAISQKVEGSNLDEVIGFFQFT
jgi:hypothetical protein